MATAPTPRAADRWRATPRLALVALTTVLLVLAGGGVAVAHPALRPAEAPAGDPTELELVMEHDCDPVDGADDPTTSVAIQVPDTIAAAEALPLAGWRTDSETDADGRTTVVEWSVEDGASPETPPALPLRLTPATATDTVELDLVVLQECRQGSYLWGGGDQDEPPVGLTVTPGTFEEPTPGPTVSSPPTGSPRSSPTPDPTEVPSTEDTPPLDGTGAPAADASQPETTGSELGPVLWALGGLAAVALVVALVARRRPEA